MAKLKSTKWRKTDKVQLVRKSGKKSFDRWWEDPSRPGLHMISIYDIAKIAFNAGRKSVPSNKRVRKALAGLLDLLDDWDAGFDGFGEVNAAERVLGRRVSNPR